MRYGILLRKLGNILDMEIIPFKLKEVSLILELEEMEMFMFSDS